MVWFSLMAFILATVAFFVKVAQIIRTLSAQQNNNAGELHLTNALTSSSAKDNAYISYSFIHFLGFNTKSHLTNMFLLLVMHIFCKKVSMSSFGGQVLSHYSLNTVHL